VTAPATPLVDASGEQEHQGSREPIVIEFPTRIAEPGSPEPAERAPARLLGLTTTAWLAVSSAVLVLALGVGVALTFTEVSRREETIRDYRSQVTALTEANLALQDQVTGLVGERDRLAQERSALGEERDALVAERDTLNATIEDLETTVAEYQKQVADLNARLGEQGRQLSQAREEASRQQTRAEEAEAFGLVMAQVVALDDEIHREFGNLLDALYDMERAYDWNDGPGFFSAYDRALQTAARLDQLFAERERLLAQLGY
jgi:predicted  nucleic acid-binding Zn-ribbon protein